MNRRIAIRGLGLVTPLGIGVERNWQAFLAGQVRTGRAELPPLESMSTGSGTVPRVCALAKLAASEDAPPVRPSRPCQVHPESTQSKLPDAQAESARARRPCHDHAANDRTALVVATSRGPADEWAGNSGQGAVGGGQDVGSVLPTADCPPPTTLSTICEHLARALPHADGPRLTLTGACASGLHALIRAALLIEHGDADRAIVVAAESSLHPMFLESFRRLGVLAAAGEVCRPFDVNRSGFFCSEAAAAVVLERVAEDELRSGDVCIDRYAFAGDASHLTGSDPSGQTLRRLLAHAIDRRPVDVIHAHGTGTEANDAAEAAAIDAVLAEGFGASSSSRPSVYSHKGAIGHTVGAAGLISVVLNVRMHRAGVVPPNANLRTPIPMQHAQISGEAVQRPIRRSVVCAAGFGGAVAAVSLASAFAPTGGNNGSPGR